MKISYYLYIPTEERENMESGKFIYSENYEDIKRAEDEINMKRGLGGFIFKRVQIKLINIKGELYEITNMIAVEERLKHVLELRGFKQCELCKKWEQPDGLRKVKDSKTGETKLICSECVKGKTFVSDAAYQERFIGTPIRVITNDGDSDWSETEVEKWAVKCPKCGELVDTHALCKSKSGEIICPHCRDKEEEEEAKKMREQAQQNQ